ncbi:hypothetical protein K490DRAFT_64191 [Saccharata proteae CBS 121410]|uniref:Rhodopsin domain-containing protein n=1 Tax=Saccharata proteae CBS 121410 TaxID=1314787 RepID=A0A6A5YAT1_9PEZI|nr:hypothetical protein K490DRAFT_64191 [Saccharata proteae CBS 121410]
MIEIYSLDRDFSARTQFGLHTFLIVLSTLLLGLRLLARWLKRVGFWWDDWSLVIALVLDFVLYGVGLAFLRYGMHTHVWVLGRDNLTLMLKLLVAYQVIYCTTLLFVKVSWCLFYLRVFVNKTFRAWVWGTLAFLVLLWTAFMLQTFLICIPFSKNWFMTEPGHCGNEPLGFTIVGILVILTDVWIVCLPLPVISKLQLDRRTKWGLYCVFGLGLFITIASCIREYVLTNAYNDIPFDLFATVYWTFIEPTVAIITACLPMVRLVVISLLPGRRWTSHDARSTIGRESSNPTAFKRIEEGRYVMNPMSHVTMMTCTGDSSEGSSKGRDSFIPSGFSHADEGSDMAMVDQPGRNSYIIK